MADSYLGLSGTQRVQKDLPRDLKVAWLIRGPEDKTAVKAALRIQLTCCGYPYSRPRPRFPYCFSVAAVLASPPF